MYLINYTQLFFKSAKDLFFSYNTAQLNFYYFPWNNDRRLMDLQTIRSVYINMYDTFIIWTWLFSSHLSIEGFDRSYVLKGYDRSPLWTNTCKLAH